MSKTHTWYDTALEAYGQSFHLRDPDALTAALRDWSQLTEAERSFAQSHLLFLSLEAQQTTQRLLRQLGAVLKRIDGALEDVGDVMEEMLDEGEAADEVAEDASNTLDSISSPAPEEATLESDEPTEEVAPFPSGSNAQGK